MASQRRALLFGIAGEVLRVDRVRTTEPRAKEARRIAERAIQQGKRGTLAARRRLEADFSSRVSRRVMVDLAARYRERRGGYTRIIKLGYRRGDRAPMAYLELVDAEKR